MEDDKMMKSLTEKQERVLQFIVAFVRKNSVPPTIREIMKGLGFSSPRPVQDHLKILQRKGYLTTKSKSSRGIELSRKLIDIPVLGRVGAGKVIADRDIEGYIDVGSILMRSGDLFGLRVKGDSMARAGIHERDIVVVRKQPFADPGDLVVALKDGEALIRWLRRNGGKLSLQADDLEGEYPIEFLTDEHTIVGRVVFLLRNYDYQLINPYN
jgi:repressor LexA